MKFDFTPFLDVKTEYVPFPEELLTEAKDYYRTTGYYQDSALDIINKKPLNLKFKVNVDKEYINNVIRFINILINNTKAPGYKKLAAISYLLSTICIKSIQGVTSKNLVHPQVSYFFN